MEGAVGRVKINYQDLSHRSHRLDQQNWLLHALSPSSSILAADFISPQHRTTEPHQSLHLPLLPIPSPLSLSALLHNYFTNHPLIPTLANPPQPGSPCPLSNPQIPPYRPCSRIDHISQAGGLSSSRSTGYKSRSRSPGNRGGRRGPRRPCRCAQTHQS